MSLRSFIDGLSDEQRDAALTTDAPVMIIAGAGSGKTRTLIGRFIHLVTPVSEGGLGADPSSVMMVTFTNKAAREMRERIHPVLEDLRARFPDRHIHDPWIGTFHGISLRILRIESTRAGLSRNFSIFDEADARSLAGDVAETLGIRSFDVDEFFSDLDLAKSRLLSASLLSAKSIDLEMKETLGQPLTRNDQAWRSILTKFQTVDFVPFYAAYQRALKDQNAVDFSDLMNTVTDLFQSDRAVRDSWRSTFRHFMVDEVQDMNRAQAAWLQAFTDGGRVMEVSDTHAHNDTASATDGLHEINGYRLRAFPRPTLAFVGDDDQSIYAFRGSDVSIMRNLPARYEGLQIQYLRASYRCQSSILAAANTLVRKNTGRFDKEIIPADASRPRSMVRIDKHITPMNEIEALTAEARRYMAAGHDPAQFAILLRTRDLAKVVAREFRAVGLPVVEGKSTDIRKTAEVRDALAFAGFLVNPEAETLLRRIINKPSRGMGPTSTARVNRNARLKNVSFIEELRSVMNGRIDLPEGGEPYGKAFIESARDFGRLIVRLRDAVVASPNAAAALTTILDETGYLPALREAALRSAGVSDPSPGMMAMPPAEFLRHLVMLDAEASPRKPRPDAAQAGLLPGAEGAVPGDGPGETDGDLEDLVDKASDLSETARRIGNLSLLLEQAQHVASLESFVQESTLEMDAQESQSGFRIMTIHSSKGLEFDRVRLPFWMNGIFPHSKSESEGPEALEEERRLAYVALTRARETVAISHSWNVASAPFIRSRSAPPSVFLDEIRAAGRTHVLTRVITKPDDPAFNAKIPFDDRATAAPAPQVQRPAGSGSRWTSPPAGASVSDAEREAIRRLLTSRSRPSTPADIHDHTPIPEP